jgi:hypothetical protein
VDDRSTDGLVAATVDHVSFLTLALPEDPADRSAALEVLAALTGLEHPHVLRCPIEQQSRDSVGVDTDDLPGPRLPQLLAGRTLSPGQVVTLGVPLAHALAAGAAVGVHHGGLEPACVVVDPDGRPLVVGLGLAQLVGAHPSASDDVHALARLLAGLLDPGAGAEGATISAALAGALSGHPLTRPTANALAAQLLATTSPVALPSHGDPIRPVRTIHPPVRKPRRWVPDRPPRSVLIAVGVVALAVVVVLLSVGRSHRQVRAQVDGVEATPSPRVMRSPSPTVIDWQATLTALAQARQRAFAQVQPTLLGDADAPGSSAAAVDRSRIEAWARAGVYLRGDPAGVQLVAVKDVGREVATLAIRERAAAFDIVSRSSGAVRGHQGAGAARAWTVTLVLTAQGWRTASVSRA